MSKLKAKQRLRNAGAARSAGGDTGGDKQPWRLRYSEIVCKTFSILFPAHRAVLLTPGEGQCRTLH